MNDKLKRILDTVNEISYGWYGKDKVIHKFSKRNFFLENYRLQDIETTIKYKVGTCWEQVEYIRYLCELDNIDVDTYIVIYNDDNKIARHSIAITKDNGKYICLENSWIAQGKEVIYDNVNDILNVLIDSYPRMYKIDNMDRSKIEVYKYNKPIPGLSYNEFSDYVRGEEKISI